MNSKELLSDLAESGSYFLYDTDAILEHALRINTGTSKLFFACKANPLGAIIQTLAKADINFDVASEGELMQVLSLGITGSDIIMTGPAKSDALIRLGLENEVSVFVIESRSQLELLKNLSKEYQYKPQILLRLQLQWDEDGENILGGKKITPFGMDLKTAADCLSDLSLPFLGFHIFQWGNILSIDKLRSIWEYTIKVCKTLYPNFHVLDVGGGLGIPYDLTEKKLPWNEVDKLITELKITYKLPEFWLEMGRYMTGSYGQYITRVIDVKETYGQKILVLEGGINHLARPALVNQNFPANLLRESEAELTKFALHGPLCTSLDFMGNHELPNDVKAGDCIIFQQVGAYGFTESMPFFLCHKLPGEAVIKNGSMQIIRKPEPAKSWLK